MGRLLKISLSMLLCGLPWAALQARTISVGPRQEIRQLKQALDVAAAGDTILLQAGVYTEGPLSISKPLSLIGYESPVLDGGNKEEILVVEADDVLIQGITFRNSGSSSFLDIAALSIRGARRVSVRNNRFENNFFGILCQNSVGVRIENNHLQSGGIKGKPAANGIHCWKSRDLHLSGNTVTGHRDGIYFEFVTQSLIENNKSIRNKRYGLHFMFSHDDTYKHNEIRGNGAGVAVMYSKRVTMLHNTFAENWGNAAYGLLLKEITDSRIEHNLFEKNTISIFGESSNRIKMQANQFISNGWAMQLHSSCSDLEVYHNNFMGNTFDVSSNGNLIGNQFRENYWDKYEGYDLNRDRIGDIPYRPVTFYSVVIARNPGALMLFRSFFVSLMDKAEGAFPALTPENLTDDRPRMQKIKF